MRKRLIVLAAILASLVIVACSVSDLVPRREASITATPTRTPKPTFTATVTPTHTLTPSPTPTPTDTPTATPIPTDTPPPTDTPTLTPTPTETQTPAPSATPTATTRATPRPPTRTPVPKPTNTPAPPFTGQIVGGARHCSGYTAVTGHIKHANGSAYPGTTVGVWSDAWVGAVSGPSEADGKYDVTLGGIPPGKFYVAVVRLGTCSVQDGVPTAINCQRLSNVIVVYTTEHCEGTDANQVPEVDFTGP
jgi:hypothetical protein